MTRGFVCYVIGKQRCSPLFQTIFVTMAAVPHTFGNVSLNPVVLLVFLMAQNDVYTASFFIWLACVSSDCKVPPSSLLRNDTSVIHLRRFRCTPVAHNTSIAGVWLVSW